MAGSLILSIIIILVDRSRRRRRNCERMVGQSGRHQRSAARVPGRDAGIHVVRRQPTRRCGQTREQKWTVLSLATVGVLLATVLYGCGIWFILAGAVPLPWCITLGALLAPTDPIAVGGLLKRGRPAAGTAGGGQRRKPVQRRRRRRGLRRGVGVGQRPRQQPGGDGDRSSSRKPAAGQCSAWPPVISPIGHCAWSTRRALELTITLALVTVTYSLAAALHVSGPLAVVVAGLLTGHRSADLP